MESETYEVAIVGPQKNCQKIENSGWNLLDLWGY